MAKNGRTIKRLNLALRQEVHDRMEYLRDETEAETITEVIKKSLAVYDFLLTQKKSGAKLIIQDEEGQREIVLFPL